MLSETGSVSATETSAPQYRGPAVSWRPVKADEAMMNALYEELRKLASRRMAGEPAGQTLQPTALVHEAWLRLSGSDANVQDRQHFFALAATAMRRILVERARRVRRQRHGGELRRVTLVDDDVANAADTVDIVDLDAALDKLERVDPHMATVVSLRYILQCTVEETATALGISPAKVKKDLSFARAWLMRHLKA